MKIQNRQILLLVDNASGHNVTESLKKSLRTLRSNILIRKIMILIKIRNIK
jgi:hypothetical protein